MLTRCLAGLTIYPTASQHATARIRVTLNQRREANPAARKKIPFGFLVRWVPSFPGSLSGRRRANARKRKMDGTFEER